MNLYKNGITLVIENPTEIARLKKAGYKEPVAVVEEVKAPSVPEGEAPEKDEGEKEQPETLLVVEEKKAPKEPKKAGK